MFQMETYCRVDISIPVCAETKTHTKNSNTWYFYINTVALNVAPRDGDVEPPPIFQKADTTA